MVSHLFYYQLALWALIWLFVMVPLSWPRRSEPPPPVPAPPRKPKRKRSTAPTAFAGLTHKPPCALCEQETGETRPAPPPRPDPMPFMTRRPRTVDTSMHFCPHTACAYRGWLGLGNRRATGHPRGGPWRQLHCTAGKGYGLETHGPLFHGKQAVGELIVPVLACLAAGLGIRATARVFEVNAHTVWHWLVEAAEQRRAFSASFLGDLHVEQRQLDEVYAGLRARKTGESSEDEGRKRLERSPSWVWTAMDPTSTLLVVVDIGSRTLARAQRVVPQVVQVLAPGGVPLCLTDGFTAYTTALLTHVGSWMQRHRRQATGPRPKPRWRPFPELLDAQVVKSYRRRRIVGVTHRVVCGTQLAIEPVLATCGWSLNTSFVARLTLDIRQRAAAIGRRVNTLCQGEAGLRDQLVLFQVYHNCVLPHASLREALAKPIPTNGHGSAKVWRPCSLAMAAGLTDHVWSLKEVWLSRVPPWPQPQTVEETMPVDDHSVEGLRVFRCRPKRCGQGLENPFCVRLTG